MYFMHAIDCEIKFEDSYMHMYCIYVATMEPLNNGHFRTSLVWTTVLLAVYQLGLGLKLAWFHGRLSIRVRVSQVT